MEEQPELPLEFKNLPPEKKTRFHYDGSLFWLIFWLIIFFPVGFTLLFIGTTFEINNTAYRFKYEGSTFWLIFWVIFFFPISFILLLLNGYATSIKEN
jgi:hypothetical protein